MTPTAIRNAAYGPALKLAGLIAGFAALAWFLIRVIPKPSRASYPCQRAAFPLASGFAIWLTASVLSIVTARRLRRVLVPHRYAAAVVCAVAALTVTCWFLRPVSSSAAGAATRYDFAPPEPNRPVGVARGIHPGRVVWAHDPAAARWSGALNSASDTWWSDSSTDQNRVDSVLASTLRQLTGSTNDEGAWQAIFRYYNRTSRGLENRGYQAGEIVAVKVNLNNSSSAGPGNIVNVSPQVALALVRQLVQQAHVPQGDIVVYEARRSIYPAMLTKIWSEFKDVRFVQWSAPDPLQPKNPGYGGYHGLEAAQWVEGVSYSANDYKEAKLIPKQVLDATYLVNLALLKAHSYPYAGAEGGDEGQTGVTMCGKNHFGSIKGTPELHAAINTNQQGVKNAYSPIVDLAASPNLGAKTILYMLDGLYCGRRHQSFPLHFPNPPFNNRVTPYENPDWPSSVLASLDGVALDSVGLDILYSQTKNNNDPGDSNHPRILLRENAGDYLREMAMAGDPPSKTVYMQGGKRVGSLGVYEHWDSDATRQYSRNKSPLQGKGIELLYLPAAAGAAPLAGLPGQGVAQHPFLYAGEWDTRKPLQSMFLVRDGKVVWQYSIPLRIETGGIQEFDDATLLPSGNIIFSRMSGAGVVSPDKKLIWEYKAPAGTEVHSIQSVGQDRVLIMRNGNPAQAMIVNTATGKTEKEIPIPTTVTGVHGQFRHIRMTRAGTILVPHMGEGKVVEYDLEGKALWSVAAKSPWHAVRLANGNTLIAGDWNCYAREVNPQGETVWELTQADLPSIKLYSVQTANRLANGNTVITNWCAGNKNTEEWASTVQVLEVTPDKKVVWALSSWKDPDLGPATSIQLLDEPGDRPLP